MRRKRGIYLPIGVVIACVAMLLVESIFDAGKGGITRAKGAPSYPKHPARVNTVETNIRNSNQRRKKREILY